MVSGRVKIIQFAYGEAALSAYLSLREHFELLSIITPPGDYALLPVEEAAKNDGVNVKRCGKMADVIGFIEEMNPDLVVVCSFDKVLPEVLLTKNPFFNVHFAPLPRYRGRATVNWAIINGEKTFAACIHKIVPELDAGDIYFKGEVIIEDLDTVKTVYDKLNEMIRNNLGNTVLAAYRGQIAPIRTDENLNPTYCCTRLPEDGLINWEKSTLEIDRLIRAVGHPFPGAFTYLNWKKMHIWKARPVANPAIYEGRIPGRVVNVVKNKGVEVLTGDGVLFIEEIELEGVGACNAADVIKSVKVSLGLSMGEIYRKILEVERVFMDKMK